MVKPPRCFSCTWCGVFRRPFRVIFGLVEIGLAIGIIVITSFHLTNYDVDLSEGTVTNYKCLLGTTDSGDDICVYTYVMSGIAIGAAILLMISAIFTCACWLYFDFVLDFIISVLAAILWFVVAAVITDYNNNQVQSETDVQKSWRNAVTTMSWVLFGLFCVDAVGSSFRFLYKACGCCGGYEAARLVEVEEELKKKDEELANLRAQLTVATGPPQPQAMEVKPDPANPGQVAVAVADSNGATPEAPAAPDTAPAKSTLYPPVPPAGAIPP